MKYRNLALALGICAMGSQLLACSSLSRPEEILISAEPVAVRKPAAPMEAVKAPNGNAPPLPPPSSGG